MAGVPSSAACAEVLSRLQRVRPSKTGWQARCPAHDDHDPSLSVAEGADGRLLLHCHAGCDLGAVTAALGITVAALHEPRPVRAAMPALRSPKPASATPPFKAQRVWAAALERARDDRNIDVDRATYAFLERRGLAEAWECGSYGVLAPEMDLPPVVASWPRSGHCLVVPLYDGTGRVANVQARNVLGREPKTLFPAGSTVRGCLFADDRARRLIRGKATTPQTVLVGEGLTDFLALTVASSVPVVAIPGTSFARDAFGPWLRGHDVVVAFDRDDAGIEAAAVATSRAYELGARQVCKVAWQGGGKDVCDTLARIGPTKFELWLRSKTGRSGS